MKQTIHSILAISENRVIGDSQTNNIPWRIPGDLKYFREMTTGGIVVMGRKTWESLPFKPLPGRVNIVVTRQAEYDVPEGVHLADSVESALEVASQIETATNKVWCIGGAELYKAFEPYVDSIYLTVVHTSVRGDVEYHIGTNFKPTADAGMMQLLDVEFPVIGAQPGEPEFRVQPTNVSRAIVSDPQRV